MNTSGSKRALEYQLQLGSRRDASPQVVKDDSHTDSWRYQGPTKVGTLTPLACLLLFLFTAPSTAAKTIRVMTYNIHVGVGMDKKLDLPRIAGVINAQHPDLVGLQEVDRGVERTQRIDEIAELAKLTHMDYAFAFNLRYQGGQYGVAILSRFPIMATDHRLYQNTREA